MQTQYQHSWTGPVSFYRSPQTSIDALPPGSVGVLGVPIDSIVVGRNGQRYGPRAIREASLYPAAYFGIQEEPGYVDLTSGQVITVPDLPRLFDVGDAPVIQNDLEAQTEAIARCAADITARGAFPVLLGGDHYVAVPGMKGFCRGLKAAKGDRKIGYLHIDSHLDFWDGFRGMGALHHGTCARRISEMPEVGNLVFYGVNGTMIAEPSQINKLLDRGAVAYTTPGIRRMGPRESMREALEIVSDGVDDVYVSVDIDVVDGAYAPGTHSIVVSGLTSEEFLDAMSVIAEFPTVGAIDLCETVPEFDTGGGRTSRIGVLGLLAALGDRILDHRPAFTAAEMGRIFR